MIKEFLQLKELSVGGREERRSLDMRLMEQPELSLGPSLSMVSESTNSSSSESDVNTKRKRKQAWDEPGVQTSIELQLNNPLPLDWEQCLDLQSGRMYYLNRKTLKKSWVRPKEQKLDLELNISTMPSSEAKAPHSLIEEESKKQQSSGGSMVAVVCVNCHLFVMLCKSSPSCPHCKHVNLLPPPADQLTTTARKLETVKNLETLSLLH